MTESFAELRETLSGAYVIERELGGGGMSRVFVARESALGRQVVVKVLAPELSHELSADRFRREIQVAATLQHPLIVPVLHAGSAAGVLYFTMPLVAGESLRARLEREGQLPIADALRILRDVASALAHAHEHGIVHRDIKPDNILLSGDYALVADFGIAKAIEAATSADRLTQTGLTLGTPAYMAPEQVVADPKLDGRADIYAVGIVAYQMLAGCVPFGGTSAQAVLGAQVTRAPEPLAHHRPAVPREIDALVMRCLAKSPADRFQHASELQRALDALLLIERSGERVGAADAASRDARPRTTRGWRAGLLVAGVALLATALGAYAWRARAARPTIDDTGDAIRSVAVLPFVNASADAQNEYFSDGVSEELIDALAKLPGLRVESRSSSFAFKGKPLGARAIGDSLHVQSVLEGSVRKEGSRLRIIAQLTRVRDGSALWSQRFDREERDVFAVQEELATAITSELRKRFGASVAMTPSATVGARARFGTADPVAYDLYLRGRHFWSQRSPDGFRKAIEYFDQAIARDSGFARAWAGLSDSWCIQSNFNHQPAREVCPRSEAAARRAIALDSTLAEAHAALGFVQLFYEWNPDAAERELDRAGALDSTLAESHLWRMHVAWARGDSAEMLRQMRWALRLEPLSPILNSRYTTALWRTGQLDSAVAQGRRTIELDPGLADGHCFLAMALLDRGALDDGVQHMEACGRVEWRAYAYARAGRRADAERILAELVDRSTREYVSPLLVARIELALGRRDDAIRSLERSYEAHEPDEIFLDRDPQLRPLFGDPRFRAIVSRVRAAAR